MRGQCDLYSQWFAVAILCVIIIAPETGLAEKPRNKGNGKGSFRSLKVIINDDYLPPAVSSDGWDPDGNGLAEYTDGVDKVNAVSSNDGGLWFQFSAMGKRVLRAVRFDFKDFGDPATNCEVCSLPSDGDNSVMAAVDARIGDQCDADGNNPRGTLNLLAMTPSDATYAEFIFNFTFDNNKGTEEQWLLSYGTPPGGSTPSGFGLPVEVTAGSDNNGDGEPDHWTIIGNSAGLKQQQVGNAWDPKYYGEGTMQFEMIVMPL